MTRRQQLSEVPVELRFIDLFLVIVAALLFVVLVLLWRGTGTSVPPKVVTRALPIAFTGESYEVPLAAAGGTSVLHWSLSFGVLPEGLELRDGSIVGRAEVAGRYALTVKVSDSEGRSDSEDLTFEVRAVSQPSPAMLSDLRIVNASALLPPGKSGAPYAYTLKLLNGFPPYRWTLAGGALPDGLQLSSDGVLSGTPAVRPEPYYRRFYHSPDPSAVSSRLTPGQPGALAFSVIVEDGEGKRLTQQMLLYVEPYPNPWWWPLADVLLLVTLVLGGFTLWMFAFGFPSQQIPGWWGLVVRTRKDNNGQIVGRIPGALAPFAITARKVLNIVLGIGAAVGELFASVWESVKGIDASGLASSIKGLNSLSIKNRFAREEWLPSHSRKPLPRLSWKLLKRRRRFDHLKSLQKSFASEHAVNDGVASYHSSRPSGIDKSFGESAPEKPAPDRPEQSCGALAGRLPTPENPPTREEQDYLDSLRMGGKVKYGGAFLTLAYIEEVSLAETVGAAFDSLPAFGRGLLHVSLDHLLQNLLNVLPRRVSNRRWLDPRFDVALGREGPARLPVDDAHRKQPSRGSRPSVPALLSDAAPPNPASVQQISVAMRKSADQVRHWLRNRASGDAPAEQIDKLAQRLLRAPAHVQLKSDIVGVRLVKPWTWSPRQVRLMEHLLTELNALEPHTLDRFRLPVRYSMTVPPRESAPRRKPE